jgi:hypothetical protein
MIEMAHFVKPIMSMTPPTRRLWIQRLEELAFWAAFSKLSDDDKYNQVQLMTMSAVDFLDQWFETDVLKATMSASGIIGTFLGVRSPGTRTCCCITTWARSTARFVRGDLRAAARARSQMRLRTRRAKRRRDSHRSADAKNSARTAGNGVVLQNGDEIHAELFRRASIRVDVHEDDRREHLPDDFARSEALQVSRLVGKR